MLIKEEKRRVNPVLENQLENSENQQEDEMDPRASIPE